MRLIILKTEDVKTACDEQEDVCKGINCKECQFNKIGIDVNYFKELLHISILDFLSYDDSDLINKSSKLTDLFIELLLKEEIDESKIGSKIFKKKIH